jgi:hypothetical protein
MDAARAAARETVRRLGPDDLTLLGRAAGLSGATSAEVAAELARAPQALAAALASPLALEAALAVGEEGARSTGADAGLTTLSPFLVFAVAVEHTAAGLEGATYVNEWTGPRTRLPVLGVDDLRGFMRAPGRRLFLADLLASFTRVTSGTVWRRARRGWRRRRFSELDPIALAGLLDELPVSEHARVHRRLGDLALFLTGVFPDHTAARAFRPIDLQRLGRAAGAELGEALEARGAVGLLERLGERWYRLAGGERAPSATGPIASEEAAERFQEARRALNLVTDRHLFPARAGLFPAV